MTLIETAQAKLNRHPADTAERKTLSGLIFPFFAPARDTSSMASSGVYTPTPITLTTVGFDIFGYVWIDYGYQSFDSVNKEKFLAGEKVPRHQTVQLPGETFNEEQ